MDKIWKIRVRSSQHEWTDLVKASSMKEAQRKAEAYYDRISVMDESKTTSISMEAWWVNRYGYEIVSVKADKQNLIQTRLLLGE